MVLNIYLLKLPPLACVSGFCSSHSPTPFVSCSPTESCQDLHGGGVEVSLVALGLSLSESQGTFLSEVRNRGQVNPKVGYLPPTSLPDRLPSSFKSLFRCHLLCEDSPDSPWQAWSLYPLIFPVSPQCTVHPSIAEITTLTYNDLFT